MDGIILVDKPAGPTSAEVVRRIKSYMRRARVGHLGTLDPFATGVLPILIGEATKLAPFIQEGDKEYHGLIALGTETDTLDRTGETTRSAELPALDAAVLAEVAARFTGTFEQEPPIFSAIKRGGVPLYRLARRGGEVAPPAPRSVTIMQLEIVAAGADRLRFEVVCSSGMYVRSLARDIGTALGTAAHLYELRRIRNGAFAAAEARSLMEVAAALESDGDPGLINLRAALPGMPEVAADAAIERRIRNGDSRALDGIAPAGARLFKVIADGRLIAIAEAVSRMTAELLRVFNPDA